MGERRGERPRWRAGVLVVALGVVATVSACGSSAPPDPAQERRDRVEHRLRQTFSARQADCILGQLDARTLRVLDRTATVAAADPSLARYTQAVARCVAPAAGGSSTTTAPATTTTTGG